MRVVLDTNVLVRATPASPGGPARELLEGLLGDPHTLITSTPLMNELADVLRRPGLRRLHGMQDPAIDRFTTTILLSSDLHALPDPTPTYVPDDPKDAVVIATAIVGRADVICTRDRHLLHPQVVATCQANGIRVVSDIELLAELRRAMPSGPSA